MSNIEIVLRVLLGVGCYASHLGFNQCCLVEYVLILNMFLLLVMFIVVVDVMSMRVGLLLHVNGIYFITRGFGHDLFCFRVR